jgi:hypothetical protein
MSVFHRTSKVDCLTLVCVEYLIESALCRGAFVDSPLFAYHAFSSSERKHWTSSRTSSFFDSGRMTDFHDLEGRAIGKYQDPLYGLSSDTFRQSETGLDERRMEDQNFAVILGKEEFVRCQDVLSDSVRAEEPGPKSR